MILPHAKRQIAVLLILVSLLPLYWRWQKSEKEKAIRVAVPDKVVVPLKEDVVDGRVLFQDFIIDGASHWYVFGSTENVPTAKMAWVKRSVLVTLLRDTDNVIINPGGKNAIRTTGQELRTIFPERENFEFKRIDHGL